MRCKWMCMPLWIAPFAPTFNSATNCTASFSRKRVLHRMWRRRLMILTSIWITAMKKNVHQKCYVFDRGNASEDTVEIERAPVSDVNGSGTSGKPAEGVTLEEEWMDIFEDLKKRMREDPVSFRPAVASFVSSLKKMKTDSELIAALPNFGITNPGPTAKFYRGRARPTESSVGEHGHGTCSWKRKAPH